MADALFRRLSANQFEPTDLARGPWDRDALHGGPSAALFAAAAQRALGDDMFPSRLTIELLRPVPVAPLTVETELIRAGRKVRLVAIRLRAADAVVASATSLGIRTAAIAVPEQTIGAQPPPPGATRELPPHAAWTAFHNAGVDHNIVAGSWNEPGPATDWIRLRVPVVDDEDTTPYQRVAAAADFGNGISSLADFESLTYINPDLTISLHRLPVGEWVCLDASSRLEPHGIGLAESALFAEQGRIGRSVQSVLVEPRS
jgi:acyl-CoA thioesterase